MSKINDIVLDVVRHLKNSLEPDIPIRSCGNDIIVPTKDRMLVKAVIRGYCLDRKYSARITMQPEIMSDDTRIWLEIGGYSHLFDEGSMHPITHAVHRPRLADIDCIKKVIFSGPCTIILWCDGTKTIVKCGPDDEFDKEKGIAMCILKKMFGSSHQMSKWMKEQIGEEEEEEHGFKLPPFSYADGKKIDLGGLDDETD